LPIVYLVWGLRYLNVGENLNIAAQKTVSGLVEQGAYNIRTTNSLFGGQLGARYRRTWGRFGYEATSNAGIFGNDAQGSQSVTDFPISRYGRTCQAAKVELLLWAKRTSRPSIA